MHNLKVLAASACLTASMAIAPAARAQWAVIDVGAITQLIQQVQTIVENCGNTLILRCSASEGGGTARFASQLIGEREVMHTTVSKSRRATEFVGSVTHSEHRSLEPAVLPSEVEQLPDLAGYLKFASDPQWQRVRLDATRAWQQRRAHAAGAGDGHGTQRSGALNSGERSSTDREFSA